MQKMLSLSKHRIFILLLAFILIPFLCVFAPVKAAQEVKTSDLKIEIIKIKDSGTLPFWSPDGKEIVFVDKSGLFVISSSGSREERKIVSGQVRVPRWSPDGKYIAFVDRKGLKIISPQGRETKLIYPDNNVLMPVWSQDSKWITFYLSELQGEEGSGVFAVNIETLESKQLSYTGINPSWSENGESVFYFNDSQSEGFGQLFLADLNSEDVKKLAPIGGICMNFNPQGNLLAFAPKRKDGSSLGIYLASPYKNDEPVKLSDDGYFPSFSYDNKWISFFKYDPQIKNTKIYITSFSYESHRPAGSELIEIGNGIYPRWAFNKKELVYEILGVRGGIYVAKILD